MFDGVPDQLRQFIAASARTSIPIPLSFSSSSLHHHVSSANTNIFPSFDPFTTSSHQQVSLQVVQPHHFLHSLQQQESAAASKNEEKKENINSSSSSLVGINNLEIERERSTAQPVDPAWSNDELLAMLRIRSSLENWFPELIWEHVSRKLEELGYKRSAEKCKEKFEEESRSFNTINYNKNYRTFFSEFDEDEDDEEQLYHGQNPQTAAEGNKRMEQPGEEEDKTTEQKMEGDPRNDETEGNKPSDYAQGKEKRLAEKSLSKGKKRKGEKNFEMFKGFCEDIVKKMIAKQEQMHSKLLEDMMKRDEEKVAREEAWKKQETDRINKELEIRAYEQAIAGDRQATIIKFLTKFTSPSSNATENQSLGGRSEEISSVKHKVLSCSNPPTSSSLILAHQNPNPTCHQATKQSNVEVLPNSISCPTQNNPIISSPLSKNLAAPQNPSSNLAPKIPATSAIALAPKNPSFPNTQHKQLVPTSTPTQNAAQKLASNDREDIGKRWPRDEVLALINLRCNLYNNGEQDKEGAARTPLWERISQGMLELGYKRSAKRCKEKWENINKYFRKTKDTNKKRSLDSRTCPYFHQLSTLYNQGTLVAPSDGTENHLALPENHSTLSQNHHGSSQGGNSSTDSTIHVVPQGEKDLVQQVPAAFEFEF